jgi:Ubiquitin-conjugating enzyme
MNFRKALMSKLKRKHSIDLPIPPVPDISSTEPSDNFLTQRHPQDPGPAISYTTDLTIASVPHKSLCQTTSDSSTVGSASPEKIISDLVKPSPAPMSSGGQDLDADWKYALELQAQYNSEDITLLPSPTPSMNSTSKKQKVDSMRDSIDFPTSIFDNDEEYAMALKAELDFEATYASQPLLLDGSLSQVIPENLQDIQMAHNLQAQFDREGNNLLASRTNSNPSDGADQRISTELLYSFGQSVLKLRCCKCSKALVYNEKEILKLTKEWSQHKRYTSAVSCPKCTYSRTSTCAGCGKAPNTFSTTPIAGISGIEAIWCCDRGRLFIIWALLSSPTLTQPVTKNRPVTRSHSASASSARKSNSQASGVGYGDNATRRRGARDVTLQINEKDSTDDEVTTTLLILSSLLPSWEKSSPFDQDPPNELTHMIRRSIVLERVSELLRNDSIDNVTKRKKLYKAVMKFVRSLTEHGTTACVVFEDRVSYPPPQSLLAVSFGDAINRTFTDKGVEKLQSLARIMKLLQLQAQTFVKQVSTVQDLNRNSIMDFSEANQEAVQLCREITTLYDYLQANSLDTAADIPNQKETPKQKEEDLIEWHRDNCVDDIPDTEIISGHHYSSTATQLANPAKGRMKRLLMEIASLRTSLPPGVYVRHGSSRLDLMKVIIVGPIDTPYENGMFEFDIWCPGNYPQEPPKVHFKTTGGGKAHFNPNLYPEGKVCLSLIGT